MFARFFFDENTVIDNKLYFCNKNNENCIQIAKIAKQKCGNIFDDYFQKDYIESVDKSNAMHSVFDIFGADRSYDFCSKIRAKRLCVVLHGWGAESGLYSNLSLGIVSKFDLVIVPDMIGFGRSPNLKSAWRTQNFVCLLERIIALFDFDELTLVGHSFGGKTILFWLSQAKRDLERPMNIILISPSGIKPRFSIKKWYKILRYKRLKKKCKTDPNLLKKLSSFGSSDYKSISDQNLKKTFVCVVGEHLEVGRVGENLRLLFIFGEKDNETPVWMGKKLVKKFPRSKLEVIGGA